MIGKLYNAVAVVAIATMLSTGGFLAFLAGSGRLSADRAGTIAAVLRGELDEHEEPEPQWGASASRGGASASRRGASASRRGASASRRPQVPAPQEERPRGQSAEEVRAARQRYHLRNLALERAKEDVAARQRLLDQALQDLLNEQEEFADERTKATERMETLTSAARDTGAQQELEYVAELQPKQAKAHIILQWKKHPADAVRIFMHLDVSRGKRILAQFKTPEELEIMSQLLEQLRLQDPNVYAKESGTTGGGPAP